MRYLRAPVSGNPTVITAGNLGIMVSGDRAAFDAAHELLTAIGPKVYYVGDASRRAYEARAERDHRRHHAALAEAITLGEAHGLDRADMLEVMAGSAVASPFIGYKTKALVDRDYTATFSTALLAKDLGLAVDAAGDVPLPVTELVRRLTDETVAEGLGDLDFLALLPHLQQLAGRPTDVPVPTPRRALPCPRPAPRSTRPPGERRRPGRSRRWQRRVSAEGVTARRDGRRAAPAAAGRARAAPTSVRELARRLRRHAQRHLADRDRARAPVGGDAVRIVTELDMSLDALFDHEAGSGGRGRAEQGLSRVIVRDSEREALDLSTGVRWERLTADADPEVDFLFVVYDAGGASSPPGQLMRHAGREYGLILSGRLEVTLGFETRELGPGDSLLFDSTSPHRLNTGDEQVTAVWVVLGRHGFGPARERVHPDLRLTRPRGPAPCPRRPGLSTSERGLRA